MESNGNWIVNPNHWPAELAVMIRAMTDISESVGEQLARPVVHPLHASPHQPLMLRVQRHDAIDVLRHTRAEETDD